jgi:outer membrane protein assembly factor BamB
MKSPKPRVNAREAVIDIRAGLSDEELMSKYGFSARGLTSLVKKLVAANLLTQEELEERRSEGDSTVDIQVTGQRLSHTQQLTLYSYRWRFRTNAWIVSSPAFSKSALFFGSWDARFYCLDRETGGQLWSYRAGDVIRSSPVVEGGLVYFGSWDSHIHAVNADTGAAVWRFKTRGPIWSSPRLAGGKAYITSSDGGLYALDSLTGEQRWQFKVKGTTLHWAECSPAADAGMVFVGSPRGIFYALDQGTGNPVWEYKAGAPIDCSPQISAGIVYFGSGEATLHAVDAATGRQRWWRGTEKAVYTSLGLTGDLLFFRCERRHSCPRSGDW